MNWIDKLALLDEEKQEKLIEKIKKEGDQYGIYPLTPSQYLLWCGYSAGETVVHHSNPGMMVRMKHISRERVLDVVEQLRQMQDPLRYRFIEIKGSYFQYIDRDTPCDLREADLSGLAEKEREAELERRCEDFYFSPIDLIGGFPAIFEVITLSHQEYALLISMHHIIGDGMTIGVLYCDICDILAGTAQKNPCQFGHYALMKNSAGGKAQEQRNKEYWAREIRHMDKYLDEPTDYSRHSGRPDSARDVLADIDESLAEAISRKAAQLGCSAYNVLSSVFSIVLQHYVQKQDLILATTLFNRDDLRFRDTAGDFASVIPLVFRGDPELTLDQYILRNTENFKEALKHGDVSITNIQQEFPHDRKENANPLYQIVFVYHNENIAGSLREQIDGVELELTELYNEKRQSHYTLDMCVEINHSAGGDLIRAHYCQRLFEHKTVQHLIQVFLHGLEYLKGPGTVKLKDIRLTDGSDYHSVDFRLSRLPKAMEPADIEPEEACVISAEDGEAAIVGKTMQPLPVNFYGDVYVKREGRWYSTGKCGKLDFDGQLVLDEKRSSLICHRGKQVDLKRAEAALKQVFSGIEVSFNYLNENELILNYSKIGENLKPAQVKTCCGFLPDLLYKTERGGQEYMIRHQRGVIRAMELLKEGGYRPEAVQIKDSDEVEIRFEGEPMAKQDMINAICSELLDDRIKFTYVLRVEESEGSSRIQEYHYAKKAKNRIELRLGELWARVLGNREFGIYDPFYEVGGNSVKIIQLMNAINEEFGTELKITDLFIYNTLHQQERYIRRYREEEPETAEVEVLRF